LAEARPPAPSPRLLIDCEEDRTLRAVPFVLLAEMERNHVVGIFPNRVSLVRMVATLLQEQDDEWQIADRRYFSTASMAHVDESWEVRRRGSYWKRSRERG
jgi:Transposase, Mutator family